MVTDCSLGKATSDYLVTMVWERKSKRHVATLKAKVPAPQFARMSADLGLAFGNATWVIEKNNMGNTVLHVASEELHYPHIWCPNPEKPDDIGFYTGPGNRQTIIDDLVDAVSSEEFKCLDHEFVVEARDFIRNDEGRVEAAPGKHDDMVMTAAIGWRIMTMPRLRTPRGRVRQNDYNPFG
jgi:hypothetical protein